ncbi:adenylate/guanylate cyclase domain-containing protein [Pikeienuella sp. HZG-20]|uniref:adenylate/guanylate cyclase domain-containing protein n=1 Tax=Paludibacillus litoralis TaxID=3133267 RepID=UPI0030EE94D3
MRAAIQEDQRFSEIFLCVSQFAAVAFFGVFYALTPKAFPASVSFEPVPWALAVYGLFTALRLRLALRNQLSPLFLSLSVVMDVGVLMLTIWSFHLQYEEPATIYLKAPTLLYVFILIALRTLRFEAGYVLLAGATAIIGWLVLVVYAVVTAGEMKITRSFAEYMTSQTILIGAEVDKLISIGAVTVILAAAVVRARRLMIRSASEAYAANALSKFFEPEVAREIRHAEIGLSPGEAVRREAAVMFLDLRDFTGLSARLQPEETLALLRAFHRRVVPAVQNNGGSIDKYLGDGVLATFGASLTSETYAADALRTVQDVLASVEAWNAERAMAGKEKIGIGVGVTAGETLVGVTGEESRLEFTVLGEVVNLAAKIEKHCKIARRPALVTLETLDRALRQGFAGEADFDRLPEQQVAGVERRLALAATGAPDLARPSDRRLV